MKRFMGTLLMGSFLIFSANVFAADAPSAGEGFNGATLDASAPNGGLKFEPNGATNANCYAYTTCASGRQISCWSTGAGCRWSYVAGVSVSCSGTGADGSYAYHNEYCY